MSDSVSSYVLFVAPSIIVVTALMVRFHWYVKAAPEGFQPVTVAVRVDPKIVVPVMVGDGEATKGLGMARGSDVSDVQG